jgi:hypothetical protein
MPFLAARSLGESFTLLALFALNGTYMLVSCIVLLVLPVYLIRRALFRVNIRRRTSSTFHSSFSTAEK